MIKNYLQITTSNPGADYIEYFIFNTNLEYIPICIIPKIFNNNSYSFYSSYFSKKINWTGSKKIDISNKLNKLKSKNVLNNLLLNELLCTNNSSFNEQTVNNLLTSKDKLLNTINNIDNSNINNVKFISSSVRYTANISFLLEDIFMKNSANIVQKYNYTRSNKELLVDNGFLAINYNNLNADILNCLMIKKDYVSEFILLNLLDKPIDNSKLQWWINTDIVLDESFKRFNSHFIKEIKATPYEIIGKQNLNNLIKVFDLPQPSSISEISTINKNLTAHVLDYLYDTKEELPELKLTIDNKIISDAKIKSIRIPKPKLITPELVA